MSDAQLVNEMFGEIAPKYDFANHFLSMGIDYYWRSKLVSLVKKENPQYVVDLATGSGDVAFALKKGLGNETKVTGIDFCRPMLARAEVKKEKYPYRKDINFDFGDCLNLHFPDQTIDVLTIAFGFRNLEDRQKGLQEMYRVLRPGGMVFILEFTQPAVWFRSFYYFYLEKILPKIANIITGKSEAYNYLASSIKSFPDKETLKEEISRAGFQEVEICSMSASIAAIHCGRRPWQRI